MFGKKEDHDKQDERLFKVAIARYKKGVSKCESPHCVDDDETIKHNATMVIRLDPDEANSPADARKEGRERDGVFARLVREDGMLLCPCCGAKLGAFALRKGFLDNLHGHIFVEVQDALAEGLIDEECIEVGGEVSMEAIGKQALGLPDGTMMGAVAVDGEKIFKLIEEGKDDEAALLIGRLAIPRLREAMMSEKARKEKRLARKAEKETKAGPTLTDKDVHDFREEFKNVNSLKDLGINGPLN